MIAFRRQRDVSRARLYPLLGVLFAAGAPLGLLVLRASLSGRLPGLRWVLQEIGSQPLLYAYLSLSTSLAFGLIGWRMGGKVDRLLLSATTDPLTGLANRRTLEERLVAEIERTARYGQPLSLLLADLDGLKLLNDRHGHEAGDLALRRIAGALRDTCRATDLAARFGGDEFVVLAPATSANDALDMAQRIREKLHALPSPWIDVGPVTVSIGVTGLDRATADTSPVALLAAADHALYQAKSAGRDRVFHLSTAGKRERSDERPRTELGE